MASEVTSQSEAKRRGEGPRAVRAWTAAWEVLNTPAGVVVSVIAALGGMMAVFLTIFLGQLNRMEDRLEEQIRGIREDIIELKTSDHEREQRHLAQMRELERRLLAQINRGTGAICEAHGYGTPKCVSALETMFDACTL